MNSREAFEAHIKNTWAEISPAELDVAQEAWKAAIQHARDVAKDCIEHELGETGQAQAINHAIKEALK